MIVGIDCDVDKNGVAVKEDGEYSLYSLSFWDLFEFLSQTRPRLVVIEGGWLNAKSNFRFAKSTSIASRMGKNVGENHAVGKKIVEMCIYLSLEHKVVKPLQKIWNGKDGKITHDELNRVFKMNFKKTNQENRDAFLLIYDLSV